MRERCKIKKCPGGMLWLSLRSWKRCLISIGFFFFQNVHSSWHMFVVLITNDKKGCCAKFQTCHLHSEHAIEGRNALTCIKKTTKSSRPRKMIINNKKLHPQTGCNTMQLFLHEQYGQNYLYLRSINTNVNHFIKATMN